MKVLNLLKTSTGLIWAYKQNLELKKLGVDIEVILPDDNGPLHLMYDKAGIKVHRADIAMPVNKPYVLGKKLENFRKLIEKIKPDIIHSHFVTNTMLCRLALGKNHSIPRLFQVPGPLHLEHPIYKYAEILTAGKNDYWAGACEKTCNLYKKAGINQSKVFLNYYGIDLNECNTKRTNILRNELCIDESTPLVGMIAYFYKPKYHTLNFKGLKGHEDFIKAFAILKQKIPNIKGVFVGKQWGLYNNYYEKIKNYSEKICGDSIIFAGYRNDNLLIYPDFDLSVSPSLTENLGAALESLSCIVPTITTCVGGFPDIIKQDITGKMVKPKDYKALANAMEQMLLNKEKAYDMAKNGRRLIEERLDVKKTSLEVLNTYNKILK